ncbi:DNA internalization-related competence protein ComEC/Rec2 [Candidatus Marinamargulisbacteria bacterium SCGC AG-414-C22]|nr:DNA internalization-related competence protein ComEC/Rec2 [Candidatus Marinamargulisbacteria bacterium SCGC AG-414-C22]
MKLSFLPFSTLLTGTILTSFLTKQYYLLITGSAILIYFLYFKNKEINFKHIFLISSYSFFALYYNSALSNRHAYFNQFADKDHQLITLIATVKEPNYFKNKNRIKLVLDKNWTINASLKTTEILKVGTTLKVTGKYISINQNRNPGIRNYQQIAIHKKHLGSIIIKDYKIEGYTFVNPIKKLTIFLKKKILQQHQAALPFEYANIYTGLIFGIHGVELSEKFTHIFKKTGLLHALVVSGSQVSLLTGLFYYLFKYLIKNKQLQLMCLCMVCFSFYLLTGGGPSIGRAILMNLISFGLSITSNNSSKISILSLTALILISMNPFVITDLGFQFSFLATASLLFGVPFLSDHIFKKIPILFANLISISLAPIVFTTPLTWYYFNTITPVSIISNLVLLEFIEFLVILGFFSTIIGFVFNEIGLFFHSISLTVIEGMIIILNFFGNLPLAQYVTTTPPKIVIIYGYLILIMCLIKKKIPTNHITLIILLFLMTYYISVIKKSFKMTYLDVGQGNAALIELHNGINILIDTGPKRYVKQQQHYYNIAKQVILPVLRSKGINKLDYIFITHFDQDHYGSLPDISKHIKIGMIIDNGKGKTYKWFRELINKYNIKNISLKSNDIIKLTKDTSITCLNSGHRTITSKNDSSLVLKVSHKEFNILFLGDISKPIERKLAKNYSNNLASNILTVAHHGSKTSSSKALLTMSKPESCIISAGVNNPYNHPAPSVIKTLAAYCKIYSTKKNGAIIISEKKNRLNIKSYLNN